MVWGNIFDLVDVKYEGGDGWRRYLQLGKFVEQFYSDIRVYCKTDNKAYKRVKTLILNVFKSYFKIIGLYKKIWLAGKKIIMKGERELYQEYKDILKLSFHH